MVDPQGYSVSAISPRKLRPHLQDSISFCTSPLSTWRYLSLSILSEASSTSRPTASSQTAIRLRPTRYAHPFVRFRVHRLLGCKTPKSICHLAKTILRPSISLQRYMALQRKVMAYSLGGKPAKADAVVRGTWIVDLPGEIRFRRYSTQSDHIGDSLEKGWRHLTSTNTFDSTRELLHGLCCAIVQQQLWAFTASAEQTWPDLESLRGNDEESIVPVDLVTCKEHGHSLDCLRRSNTCKVHWSNNVEWTALENACAETLSWRSGKRICMQPGLVRPPLAVSLRPLPDGALLFTSSEPPQAWQNRIPHTHVLLPLNITAIQLDASPKITSAQSARLGSMFDQLGHGWKNGRNDIEIMANLSDKPFSEWAIFWVALSKDASGQGVMTIWPIHLAKVATAPSLRSRAVPPARSSVSDLMSTAAAVYDTLANYREPRPANDPSLMDEPMEPEPEPDEDAREQESTSDVNDLFSATSSPAAPERFEPQEEEPREVQELRELFKSPDVVTRQDPRGETTEVGNMITEDDFNFFDSPADEEGDTNDVLPGETVEDIQEKEPSPIPPQEATSPPTHNQDPVIDIPTPIDTDLQTLDAEPSRSPLLDLVPDPFSPVSLIDATSPLPSAAYRSRIGASDVDPVRSGDYGYATMWGLESDDSGSDDEHEYDTRDPPTPRTDLDSASGFDVPMHDEQPSAASSSDSMPAFRGISCIGPEWIAMLHQPEACRALARPWDASWTTKGLSHSVDHESPSAALVSDLASRTDLNRAVNTLVASRHIRQAILDTQMLPEVTESGVRLADLITASSEHVGVSYTQPQVHLGFNNMIIKLSIASLRFWRELNLQPAGGKKQTTAYVVCEDATGWRDAANQFLTAMREGWEAHSLGVHHQDSVMPVSPSTMADTIRDLSTKADSTIYVLLSSTFDPSLIPHLFFSDLPPNPTSVIHIVPPHVIDMPPPSLLFDSYNLVPRIVRRVNSHRPFAEPNEEVFMQYPHFTLAPDSPPKPIITLAWPVKSYDILNRWRLLHCAYTYDPDRALVIACAIDGQGDNCELRHWIVHSAREAVERVWDWSTRWAGDQSVEWRLGVCRLGLMSADEYQAWRRYTDNPLTLFMSASSPPTYQSNLVAQRHGNVGASVINDPATRLVDESMLGQYWPLTFRSSVSLPGDTTDPFTLFLPTFILSQATPDASAHGATTFHLVAHTLPDDPAFKDEDPMALFGKEYHRLACYARARFGFESGLPAHLECVQAADGIVDYLATHLSPATDRQ